MNNFTKLNLFILFFLFSFYANAQTNYTELTDKIDLLTLHINTNSGEQPGFQTVYSPYNCDGIGITNAEKLKGDLTITRLGETIYSSGEYKKDESGITIKVRGNTSANASEKKPYKIKLQKKADLLFRGDKKFADKNWVLIDIDDMLTYSGNMVNKFIGMKWTPEHQYAFVFLNGDFRGLYILSESIERNEDCRIDVSKKGFIFEYDAYWWNEDLFLPSTKINNNYTLKYPDVEDLTIESKNYLTNEIAKFERGFFTKNSISDNIDLHSFARWLMVHDIIGSIDPSGSNLYFSKNDASDTSPISMICAWDFGGTFHEKNNWSKVHNFWWFAPCFNLPQKDFIDEYLKIYDTQVNSIFDSAIDSLNRLKNSEFANVVEMALDLESARWSKQTTTFPKQIENIISYLTARKQWMAEAMNELRGQENTQNETDTQADNTPYVKIQNDNQYMYMNLSDGKTLAFLCSEIDSIGFKTTSDDNIKDSLLLYFNDKIVVKYELALIDSLSFEYADKDFVIDDCGNTYAVTKIGNQYWMAENLKCDVYSANSEIGKLAGRKNVNLQTSASRSYNPYYVDATDFESSPYTDNLTPAMKEKFGYLYNWAAAVGIKENALSQRSFDDKRQGICPDGFYMPTKKDWETLCENLYGYNDSGKHLKTQDGWYKGPIGSAYSEGLEDVGLNSLPTGYATGSSNINHVGQGSYFWSADVFGDESQAYGRYLFYNTSKLGDHHYNKESALSVRCVR